MGLTIRLVYFQGVLAPITPPVKIGLISEDKKGPLLLNAHRGHIPSRGQVANIP